MLAQRAVICTANGLFTMRILSVSSLVVMREFTSLLRPKISRILWQIQWERM
jgi:hypothetical protein